MREIELTLSGNEYFTLNEIAKNNHTTIDEIVNKYLKLCVKEDGLVVWNNGFDNAYDVLKTKEKVNNYLCG